MSQKKKKKKLYNIERVVDGYAVFDDSGNQMTPANVWPITIKLLENIFRKELEI